MKKIFLVLCLLISMAYYSSYAFQPDTNRWYWIYSNTENTIYVDLKTLKYDKSTDSANFYLLSTSPADNTFDITSCEIDFRSNTFYLHELYRYSAITHHLILKDAGNVIQHIIPSSGGETIRNVIAGLTGRNETQAYLEDIRKNPGHIAY